MGEGGKNEQILPFFAAIDLKGKVQRNNKIFSDSAILSLNNEIEGVCES